MNWFDTMLQQRTREQRQSLLAHATTLTATEPKRRRIQLGPSDPNVTVHFETIPNVYADKHFTALLNKYKSRVDNEFTPNSTIATTADGDVVVRESRIDFALLPVVPLWFPPIEYNLQVDCVARGLYARGKSDEQQLHTDGGAPHTGFPKYLTLITALQDITDPVAQGATEFVLPTDYNIEIAGPTLAYPYSIADPRFSDPTQYMSRQFALRANEGIVFDGRILHRGPAVTTDQPRPPIVYQVFKNPYAADINL